MKQTFKLKKGEILFEDEKIIIQDDAKKQKWILSLILCFGATYGILTFLKYFKTGSQFDFWVGLIIGLLNISILLIWLLRSIKSEIYLDTIKSMKLKQKFSNKILDIKLKNNRIRRVICVDNEEELGNFIEIYLETK